MLPFHGAMELRLLIPKPLALGWVMLRLWRVVLCVLLNFGCKMQISKWLKTIYNPAQWQRLG